MLKYGIIGDPVEHSLSPVMHNAAFKALDIKAEYIKIPIAPDQLEGFLLGKISVKDIDGNRIHAREVKGFNVTIPYKVNAEEILDKKLSPSHTGQVLYDVQLSGAINTVKREGDTLEYWNTDVSGFRRSLTEDLKFYTKDKNVLIIGCGGAGRAVVAGLIWKDTSIHKIYIYENNEKAIDSAKEHFSEFSFLKEKIKFIPEKEVKDIIKKCQLLVNASPLGMKEGDPSPIDKRLLRKDLYVYDVVYNRKTQLVKDAGAKAMTGSGMLAWQGALAFDHWVDECKNPADVIDVMRKALDDALKNKI